MDKSIRALKRKQRQRYIFAIAAALWIAVTAITIGNRAINVRNRSLGFDDIELEPFGQASKSSLSEKEVFLQNVGERMVKALNLVPETDDMYTDFIEEKEIE